MADTESQAQQIALLKQSNARLKADVAVLLEANRYVLLKLRSSIVGDHYPDLKSKLAVAILEVTKDVVADA